jgi:hypothetical protein
MNPGRFFHNIVALAIVLTCFPIATACAGFGFGGDEWGKSGLDFNKGYDVNTVTTVSGRVLSAPRTGGKEHLFVDVKAGSETISLNLGPKASWDGKAFQLHANDDIRVKGSIAQGKDGKTYLMVQKISNQTTGSQLTLRNESGAPGWPGRNAGGMMPATPSGMMNGGGGMMRGGGGMMKR